MRVFAISDIHTDHKQNLQWVRHLSLETDQAGDPMYSRLADVLIVAGDVTHKPDVFR